MALLVHNLMFTDIYFLQYFCDFLKIKTILKLNQVSKETHDSFKKISWVSDLLEISTSKNFSNKLSKTKNKLSNENILLFERFTEHNKPSGVIYLFEKRKFKLPGADYIKHFITTIILSSEFDDETIINYVANTGQISLNFSDYYFSELAQKLIFATKMKLCEYIFNKFDEKTKKMFIKNLTKSVAKARFALPKPYFALIIENINNLNCAKEVKNEKARKLLYFMSIDSELKVNSYDAYNAVASLRLIDNKIADEFSNKYSASSDFSATIKSMFQPLHNKIDKLTESTREINKKLDK